MAHFLGDMPDLLVRLILEAESGGQLRCLTGGKFRTWRLIWWAFLAFSERAMVTIKIRADERPGVRDTGVAQTKQP
jgi:hypothetical protein